jgi:hypothetical protein
MRFTKTAFCWLESSLLLANRLYAVNVKQTQYYGTLMTQIEQINADFIKFYL